MALVPWEAVADILLPDVPGAEWPMARLALIRAAREFYDKSHAWREFSSPLVTAKGVPDYDVLDVPVATVISLLDVYVGPDPIYRILTPAEYGKRFSEQPGEGTPDAVSWFKDLLWLHPTPMDTGRLIRATTVLKPTLQAGGLPDEIFELHLDALVLGARAKLYGSPGKPYSNPNDFVLYQAMFEKTFARARAWADTGGTETVSRTTSQFI